MQKTGVNQPQSSNEHPDSLGATIITEHQDMLKIYTEERESLQTIRKNNCLCLSQNQHRERNKLIVIVGVYVIHKLFERNYENWLLEIVSRHKRMQFSHDIVNYGALYEYLHSV